VQSWARDLDKDWHWLPKLAPCLSLLVPEPVAKGRPALGYPFSWAIYRWIDDEHQAARDLAQFVAELHRMDPVAGAPRGGRKPLRALDVGDATWNRARGFALHQAAMIIPYYSETNPGFVTLAKRTVEEILADINA
jgi:aminoglycoside phosphotransferase (APT) family kinase protein